MTLVKREDLCVGVLLPPRRRSQGSNPKNRIINIAPRQKKGKPRHLYAMITQSEGERVERVIKKKRRLQRGGTGTRAYL